MKTRLSVNINKIAVLRNSRGGNIPDLLQMAKDCEAFGAEGITVHPRPDERHIRRADVYDLKKIVTTEFNIEGYPDEQWMKVVMDNMPAQATLVPDNPAQLTSDHGWDTWQHAGFLKNIVSQLRGVGIRVSLFVDADEKMVEGAKRVGADRIEFYTGVFAKDFYKNKEKAIESHVKAAKKANELGLGINAGHDLNLDNLKYYAQNIEGLLEVSIGHALISDALYYGLHNTIQMYLRQLK
jgi:pyridoxine 5-phosphate synthase